MLDWLIQNGTVVDGSGGAPFVADVAVRDGRIIDIQPHLNAPAKSTLDARGLVVSPGFIDIHRHADAAVLYPDFGEGELRQGITTIVNGNCGLSAAPVNPAARREFMQYLGSITGPMPQGTAYTGFGEYMALLAQTPLPLNVGTLVGSGTLRAAAAGFAKPLLEADDLASLHAQLNQALNAGAFGVSVGLGYLPDGHYTPETLARALAPIAGAGIPITVHVRGEGDLLYQSVQEMLLAARLLNAPLEISHFKCIGKANWGHLTQKTIALLDAARAAGQPVSCDVYPWTAGSTQLACLLPPAFLEDGAAGAARLLQDPARRAACRAIMQRPAGDFENISYLVGWENVMVDTGAASQSIADIAEARGCDPYDAAFDLLVENGGDVSMVDTIACEEDIETILQLPYSSVISDAVYPQNGRLHPRNFATVPRIIEHYVGRRGVMSLPQAVHKMTAAPAQALGITGKGLLGPGLDADVVVFDPAALRSEATYQQPRQYCTGVRLVLVNGRAAVECDTLTGQKAGRSLRR